MEPADCGRCNETTSEYLELGETAYCGTCIKDVLEPVVCCTCQMKTDLFIDLPLHKHPDVYCGTCINELESHRIAELDRRESAYTHFHVDPPTTNETGTPENKKQKK